MAMIDCERALALVGAPFRAQGRDPKTGLDCAGLALAAYGLESAPARRDYRLRGDHKSELLCFLASFFRRVSRRQRRPGDLLLMAVASDQFHLGVLTQRGFVHADAGLHRTVETPGDPTWPLVGIFRRRVRQMMAK